MTPAEVIALLSDPEKLMRKCYLAIAGGATRGPKLPNAALPPPNGNAVTHTFNVSVGSSAVSGFTTGMSGALGRTKD